jgi:hypothetical protein
VYVSRPLYLRACLSMRPSVLSMWCADVVLAIHVEATTPNVGRISVMTVRGCRMQGVARHRHCGVYMGLLYLHGEFSHLPVMCVHTYNGAATGKFFLL